MKVGDLVKLSSRCRGSGPLALIVEVHSRDFVMIMFLNTGMECEALKDNLVMISESR